MSPEKSSRRDLPAAPDELAMHDPCLPGRETSIEDRRFAAMPRVRRQVQRGQGLFRRGDPFSEIHVVRRGWFKTRIELDEERDQVTGFQATGDVLGLDAIGERTHRSDAISLVDSEVLVLDFASLTALARKSPEVQQWLCHAMSLRIAQLQSTTVMLGRMRADERVASFVVNLAQRGAASGPVADTLELKMTRMELGSYLGLTLETVSRCFSKLRDEGIVDVHLRDVRILDFHELSRVSRGKRTLGLLHD